MKKITVLALSLVMCLSVSLANNVNASAASANFQDEIDYAALSSVVQDIYDSLYYILDGYVGSDVTIDELKEAAMDGIFSNLDEYSEYYTDSEFNTLMQSVEGNFVGIGIEMSLSDDGYISVVRVLKGTPAERAGIKADDKIVKVDGKDIKDLGLSNAGVLIKGEKNTTVNIELIRAGKTLSFSIKRDVIQEESVTVTSLSDVLPKDVLSLKTDDQNSNIRYVQIASFTESTAKDFKKLSQQFEKEKVTDLIIDLRYNGGGLVDAAVEISRLLVPKGKIVELIDKSGSKITYASTLKNAPYKIHVLVNEYTASASEILASAIQESGAGKLYGQKTFGKGVVQTIVPLESGGAVKITTSEYLTRKGNHLNNVGITPDVLIEQPESTDGEFEDAVLIEAYKNIK